MPAIDLKKLLLLINDEKDLQADLCLDLNCSLVTDDPRPFIRSVNYIINYLRSLSTATLHIGLSAQKDVFIISFLVHPLDKTAKEFRPDVANVMEAYGLMVDVDVRPGAFAKVVIRKRNETT